MSYVKVPGSKNYRADSDGVRELMQSAWVGSQTLDAAQRIAGGANGVGEAAYEAASQTVPGGWKNEPRAGAVARVVTPHWRDSRDAILSRVARSMAIRGGE